MNSHDSTGIDPDDLATTLRVLEQLHKVPDDHPDHVTSSARPSHMYKSIKAERKLAKRPRSWPTTGRSPS